MIRTCRIVTWSTKMDIQRSQVVSINIDTSADPSPARSNRIYPFYSEFPCARCTGSFYSIDTFLITRRSLDPRGLQIRDLSPIYIYIFDKFNRTFY